MEEKTKRGMDFVVALAVFAITGMITAYLSGLAMHLLGIKPWTLWYILGYIILIIPLYQAMLLIIAFLFGRFNYFVTLQKKMFQKVVRMFK